MIVKEPMKGYKAFNHDLTCKDFQYEIGKTYEIEGDIIPCSRGFHFCKSIGDCYKYYNTHKDVRICEVEALGYIVSDDNIKYVTNKIKIIAEVTEEWMCKGNVTVTSTGYCNAGDYNSGKHNTGDYNSGHRNTGDSNLGDRNTGNHNLGSFNCGDKNYGNWNSADYNTGNYNTGSRNTGSYNSGKWNDGRCNTGHYNTGDKNSGKHNLGDCNTGDWNCGSHSAGCFCTESKPTIKFFNKDSDWTYSDWIFSTARDIMDNCPFTNSHFVDAEDMTKEEKEEHPEYEYNGGFLKVTKVTDKDRQEWWNNLSEYEQEKVKKLPNFDSEIFKKCTGIDVNY